MRHLVGLLALVALVAIAIGMLGLELPFGRSNGAQPGAARSGVRALGATPLVRVGNGAPAGGELAFLALEPSGNLVVTDRARKSVLRFDAAGHLLSEWGPRLGDQTIVEPAGVAVAGDSYYVLDRGQPRIFQLDANGRLQNWFSLEGQGPYGLNGLAVDPAGNLYVADTGRNRILVYAPNGTFIRQFGRRGTGLGEFVQPMSMAFLPDGSLVVSDWENSRLERWDTSFDATDAWSIGYRAFGVAADQDGRIYAPDPERKRIGVYSATGDTLAEIGGPGGTPIEISPRQVAIGPAQPTSLYVLGGDGIARVDLDTIAAPVGASSSDVDLLSPIVLVLLLALPLAALLLRRGRSARGSVAATSDGEVGLQAEDRAQGQHQQPQANQEPVVAHQAEREQQSAHQHHEPVRDRQTGHRD
jgi:sugar lactone lactonase YvrE